VQHDHGRDHIDDEDQQESDRTADEDLGAQLMRLQDRAEVGEQAGAATAGGQVDRPDLRAIVAGAHATQPARRTVHRQQAVVEARSGERRNDDVCHRHDAYVAHRALELAGNIAVEHRHDQRHAGAHALHDEGVA
jgi:hypothetical protein